jgi:hypothetical protein
MIKVGKRGGESIQGYRCHKIRSMKSDNLKGNSEGRSKCQFVPDRNFVIFTKGEKRPINVSLIAVLVLYVVLRSSSPFLFPCSSLNWSSSAYWEQ